MFIENLSVKMVNHNEIKWYCLENCLHVAFLIDLDVLRYFSPSSKEHLVDWLHYHFDAFLCLG